MTELLHTPRRPAPPDQEPPAEVRLLRGDAIRPEPISWLWNGWLARGKLHVLAGAPGTGKSTIAFALAAAITAGRNWPDGTRAPHGNVLIWSGEDDPADTILPRLLAAGADPRRVHIVAGTDHGGEHRPFDPSGDMDALRDKALQLSEVHLLVADPIVSAVTGDSHKNTEVRRSLQPLVDLGARIKCAVLGISHFSKGTAGRDPTERVTGSIAFAALARVVMATAKSEDGWRILARTKSNIGADDGGFKYTVDLAEVPNYPDIIASRIRWGEAVTGSARELLGIAEAPPENGNNEARDAQTFLRELLTDGPLSKKEVQMQGDGAGYSWRTLQRAMRPAGIESQKTGFGQQAVWRIKGDNRPPATHIEPSSLQSRHSRQHSNSSVDGATGETKAPMEHDDWADAE